MEDIEDLFKNANEDDQTRIPDSKRKIVRKFGAKKSETSKDEAK